MWSGQLISEACHLKMEMALSCVKDTAEANIIRTMMEEIEKDFCPAGD